MWIFLTTDAMSFSGLLIAYGILRSTRPWPNPVEALGGVELSGLMTFLLICSSVSMVMSIDAAKRLQRKQMLNWLLVTILGGATFLGLQVYEYSHLMHEMGMTLSTYAHGENLFSSTFFAITGFHGLHVLTGTLYLIYMYVLAQRGRFDGGDYDQLEVAGLFWHFVDLVWILVFTFVYLI
ncbi:MAG: cytochrome oxidase subunit III [Bdellovibrionales bacterium CG12_big_fil_rev_8_21_14_0_65_38_15]|nr:MAG: cytochrome oxidase subunit III [Bdellovibrionales bacterium CG22_combo_CG10-13_8_21_14_all_38_13]PIQ57370.1 MAG: cytochrome oxidase subunit III [Bdellovibrionales bacterium CG12_big_fil_rev_8_21_14_0_65_38_15]PIR28917.1 MAG: cytochrome oxidase subunit III [Bdellovibrionales bacterium CG11_big_fil_rev_8_21_14_0_20_38_13]